MRARQTRQFMGAVVLAIAVGLGPLACDTSDTSTGPEGPPRLTVLFGGANTLPTASGDAALFAQDEIAPTEVWVKVEDVCLQGVGDGDQEGDQNGRQCLLDTPTDWIAIAGPSAEWEALVEDVEVPPGAHQLRFILMDVVIVANAEGTDHVYSTSEAALTNLNAFLVNDPAWVMTGEAHCPSCTRSGLKVAFPGGDPDMQDGEYVFLAQFDVSESFGKLRGNSGRWVMHPLIRGTLVEQVGSISGTVSVDANATLDGVALPGSCGGQDVTAASLLEYFKPLVSNGTSREATPDPSTGAYEIAMLPAPATYTLGWVAPVDFGSSTLASFTATVTDPDGSPNDGSTQLVPGQAATVDYLITAATCGG